MASDTTMSEEKKSKKSRDGVEKKHKKEKKEKREKHGSKDVKQLMTAEAAFSLLADEKTADPALAALFAAKVRYAS